MLAVTSFEAINSVFKINDENNSFSNATLGRWSSQNAEETINKLKNLIDFRSQNRLDLLIKEVTKRKSIKKFDGQDYPYWIY